MPPVLDKQESEPERPSNIQMIKQRQGTTAKFQPQHCMAFKQTTNNIIIYKFKMYNSSSLHKQNINVNIVQTASTP